MRGTTVVLLSFLLVALSGCFDDDPDEEYCEPGECFEETGRTVRLKMSVVDILQKEVYEGGFVDQWAFCVEPQDPTDQVAIDAIEYWTPIDAEKQGEVQRGTNHDACSVPGATIRVQQGDTVIVQFSNTHTVHPHTIHWHGQYVPWDSDGVPGSTQDSVQPGEIFTYEFVAKRAGTLWYHCHVDTQFHVMKGLFGMIIVEPQDDELEPEDIDREYNLILSTGRRDQLDLSGKVHAHPPGCNASGLQGCQNPARDLDPDMFFLNGHSAPYTFMDEQTLIELGPEERVRLRILNAGTTFETMHPHGHDLLITHIDGHPLQPEARYYTDSVTIGPGQRIDAVLEGRPGNEGVWVFHTHVVTHVTNDGQYPGGMLTKIVYPEFMDDIQPYDGVELPGGQPRGSPLVDPDIPEDFFGGTSIDVVLQQSDESSSWTFTVEMACAVERMLVAVEADGDTAPVLLNNLTATFTDTAGLVLWQEQLGATRSGGYNFEYGVTTYIDQDGDEQIRILTEDGPYMVTIAGLALDTTIDINAAVLYFDDLDEMYENNACGFTQG